MGLSQDAVVSAGMEAAVAALALGYGLTLHHLLPRRFHVLTNPLAAVALTGLARAAGVRRAGQGLDLRRAGAGLVAGLGAAAPLAGAVAACLAVPATRRFFDDGRLAALTRRQALYEAAVRIPIATALAEEVVFRGALLGVLLRRHPPVTAAALSSIVFGLWHLLPGSEILDAGPAARVTANAPARAAAPAHAPAVATILATTAAGWGLAGLRLGTGSVLAPAVAHAALNSAALLAGWLVSRRALPPVPRQLAGDAAHSG